MNKKKKQPETSLEAFKSIQPEQLAEIYQKILSGLAVLGESTTQELAAYLKIDHAKVWKRMNELHKAEKIYRPGNKRMLKSGRFGFTWMLTSQSLPKTTTTEKALKGGKSIADYSREIIKKSTQTDLFIE